MDRIEPDRLDLAREFKSRPIGPHSRDLQKVLNIMRWLPAAGKPVIVCTKPHLEWCVGELPAERGLPVVVHRQAAYASIEEAFWQVFKLRWQLLTGCSLCVD